MAHLRREEIYWGLSSHVVICCNSQGGSYNNAASVKRQKIRALQPQDKPYRVKDAGGLFLDLRPTGAKYFRIAYCDNAGKVQTKTQGSIPLSA